MEFLIYCYRKKWAPGFAFLQGFSTIIVGIRSPWLSVARFWASYWFFSSSFFQISIGVSCVSSLAAFIMLGQMSISNWTTHGILHLRRETRASMWPSTRSLIFVWPIKAVNGELPKGVWSRLRPSQYYCHEDERRMDDPWKRGVALYYARWGSSEGQKSGSLLITNALCCE